MTMMRPDFGAGLASGAPLKTDLLGAGLPWPLGAHWCDRALNFAVWAPDASQLELCLFDATGTREQVRLRLPACTDGVWHGRLQADDLALLTITGDDAGDGIPDVLVYGWRAHGPWAPAQGHRFNPAKVLLDPYATELVGRYAGDLSLYQGHDAANPQHPDIRDNAPVALKALVRRPEGRAADRSSAVPRPEGPRVAPEMTVLYEVHVKGATRLHPDVPEPLRGSYAGLASPAMIAHYRALGVTTLSLLPVHARADEERLQHLGLTNYWGYSSIAFLAPEPRYWSGRPGTNVADEFREMVASLHAAGLEVVLDVVYNHSAETDDNGPTLSFRGLANARYYHLETQRVEAHHPDAHHPDGHHGAQHRRVYQNWSGCGNSLNLAEPRVVQLVIESLRHWVLAYGVDGFRFDLAPILARGRDGQFGTSAGFFAALQADPVLSRVKLIAEPWDIGPGGYQLGGFPPGWQEWNDQFRDTLRTWWLRCAGDRGVLAHRLAGSSTQFHHDGRSPLASVNFITAHDGFGLRDLVSFNHKHNDANGEHNRDGHHHNCSWNCGVEGDTDEPEVLALRARLQRALLACLVLSQGTPMLLAGDEIGHSQRGNNNAYCQDNPLTWLDWAGADRALLAFASRLLALRRCQPSLRISSWLTGHADRHGRLDVLWWHPEGHALAGADWAEERDRAMGVRLDAGQGAAAALLLFNPNASVRRFVLPAGRWVAQLCSASLDGEPGADQQPCVDDLVAPHGACDLPARAVLVLLDGLG
ncbi:glycogen debranching enzyme GlgX [Leptothrix cholodnii SP-6]|uniref:Glycogen debranching enzyme GlgX n=2 Tax=Leptothrix cholodnii TaxID=34029 RepID=B1Y0P6_LEPCP|nr:glycogen debranching enzyme GlgX [Leptothrix cholodnii SP-6]